MRRRKMLLVVILILSMLLQCVMPFVTVHAADEEADDSNVVILLNSDMYKAVKAQLKEQGIVAEYKDANCMISALQSEFDKVTKLNLSNSEISDLGNGTEDFETPIKGLEVFTNLAEINLHANYLTKDSNLQMLDNFEKLTKVDLSSNQIASVKSIENFHNGKASYDITDQRITSRKIITIDDSSEAESRLTKAIVNLPDILLENETGFDPAWLYDNNGFLTREFISYTDSETHVTTSPEIDYANSFGIMVDDTELEGLIDCTDEDATAPYPCVVLNVATGSGESYTTLKGLVKFKIIVNDSTSKLANTQMTFYYAIVDEEETGITFDDGNLYKAVKDQLKKDQTINDDRMVTTITDEKDMYSRAYDEALIMVIDTNRVVNNVPTLILNDKRIKDLKGIEEFIGLETNLNLSYNYITNIGKIVELEENKTAMESVIQGKYAKVLSQLSEIRTKIATLRKDRETKIDQIVEKTKAYNDETNAEKKATLYTELENLYAELANIENQISNYQDLESTCLQKLYSIYSKEYLLTTLLPWEVNSLTKEQLNNSTLANVKSWAEAILSKVSNLEQSDSLLDFESNLIVNVFGIPTAETVTVLDESGNPTSERKIVDIENPISKYFDTYKQEIEVGLSDQYAQYYRIVSTFKYLDVIVQAYNYCLTARMNLSSQTDCLIEDALQDIKEWYEANDLDTSFVEYILTSGNAYESYIPDCSGAYTTDYDLEYHLAGKLVNASGDLSHYIVLPALQRLNLEDNKVRSLKGIDALSELKELNAWKNMVNNIKDVDWSVFEKIKVLNLGYNQISDIDPLKVLHTLQKLNVSYNLLEGRFNFNLINMRNLVVADFSHNQYNDIGYAKEQHILKALGYDADHDGHADGLTVPEYLRETGIVLSFQYQTLDMETTITKTSSEFVEFDLPLFFSQVEEMDNSRTSFGVDSIGGLVEPEGKTVKLRVPDLGEHRAVVSVQGRNGYGDEVDTGIGYGTTCTIYYTVVEGSDPTITPTTPETPENPENPETPENPSNPTNPENPTNPTNPTNPENPGSNSGDLGDLLLGYSVANGYVYVYTPETSLETFMTTLVDTNNYTVNITDNKSSENIGTGSVATISNKDGSKVYDSLEVVVKGDINGDGEVDALDSGIIRTVINDTAALVGVYDNSADVNQDGDIDSLDSLLILQYRADRIANFVK